MDVLKVIVVLGVLYFFISKGKPAVEPKYFRIMLVGLLLLLFGAVLDFADDFRALDNVFILGGRENILHDFLEDQIGGTLGFILFAIPAILCMSKEKREAL